MCVCEITDRRQHYYSYGVSLQRKDRLAGFKNKIVEDEPKNRTKKKKQNKYKTKKSKKINCV